MLATTKTMKIITIITINNPMGEVFFVRITIQSKITRHRQRPLRPWVNTGQNCVLSLSLTTAVDQRR